MFGKINFTLLPFWPNIHKVLLFVNFILFDGDAEFEI